MLDHILLDVIGALRRALEGSLLEQLPVEERFQIDVFLGDVSFETSYSLPGEQSPPRVRADISLEWPTWSQSAYRSWSIGELSGERPELVVEIALRLQRLAALPDARRIRAAVGDEPPRIGTERLERNGPTIEQHYSEEHMPPSCSVEIAYQGAIHLEERILESPELFEAEVEPLARFLASALVRLADLDLPVLPDEPDTDGH
jgi:hypothetical protein